MRGNLEEYAVTVRNAVFKNIGIPVGVGLGPTKTLAKIANKIAKKGNGVFIIDSERKRDWALRNTQIEDVWGIGRQYTKILASMGVNTAHDFTQLDTNWVRAKMTVVGLRTKEELLGNPCIAIESVAQPKKTIATTRAFGKKLSDINTISEAVSSHAVRCAEKLRRQKSTAQFVTLFIHTDPFSANEKYVYKAITITLPVASSSNNDIVKAALKGLRRLYQTGLLYKKTGVIVTGLASESYVQGNLFEGVNSSKFNKLSEVADKLNGYYGKDKLKLAVQGSNPDWKLRQEKLSPRYTTRWNELLNVKA